MMLWLLYQDCNNLIDLLSVADNTVGRGYDDDHHHHPTTFFSCPMCDLCSLLYPLRILKAFFKENYGPRRRRSGGRNALANMIKRDLMDLHSKIWTTFHLACLVRRSTWRFAQYFSPFFQKYGQMDLFWRRCHGFFLMIESFWFLHKWEKESVIFRICLFVPELSDGFHHAQLPSTYYSHFLTIFKPLSRLLANKTNFNFSYFFLRVAAR